MKRSRWQEEHIKKLDWAIQLCQRALEDLKPGALLDLKSELLDFILDSPLKLGLPSPEQLTNEDIRTVQDTLLKQLRRLASQDPDKDKFVHTERFDASVSVLGSNADRPFMHVVNMGNTLPKRTVQAFFDHLVYSGITREQLRVCPTCQSMFLTKRKPRRDKNIHCSLRCSRNSATKTHRERKKDAIRRAERQRSRTRYEKRIRTKPGMAKVIIQRKPRTKE